MSLNPGGRASGVLHLAMQFPKLATCLAAVGLVVVSASAVPADQLSRFVPLWAIEAYCKDPAHPPLPLPPGVWKQFDKTCACVTVTCH